MTRPVPVPDEVSAPFWDAAAAGELVLARCDRCRRFAHPPEPVCPHCLEGTPAFEPAPSTGTVRSWTVVRQSFLPGLDDVLPLVLVDVEVDADVRLIGRLVEGEPALGVEVRVVFDVGVPAFAVVDA